MSSNARQMNAKLESYPLIISANHSNASDSKISMNGNEINDWSDQELDDIFQSPIEDVLKSMRFQTARHVSRRQCVLAIVYFSIISFVIGASFSFLVLTTLQRSLMKKPAIVTNITPVDLHARKPSLMPSLIPILTDDSDNNDTVNHDIVVITGNSNINISSTAVKTNRIISNIKTNTSYSNNDSNDDNDSDSKNQTTFATPVKTRVSVLKTTAKSAVTNNSTDNAVKLITN